MTTNTTKTAIILCTYNGEHFLQEQLNSFAQQTYSSWSLFVYDDGSTDSTEQIINQFAKDTQNQVVFIRGRNKGFAQNFLSAIESTPEDFDFFALSDQDDVWEPEKIERAIRFLHQASIEVNLPSTNSPALYCSCTSLIDKTGNMIGRSPIFQYQPSFRNALVQSIAGGNSMVLNKAAKKLVQSARSQDKTVVSHDWWIYQLVTGVEGYIFYDKFYDQNPQVLYRQHGSNLMGSNVSLAAKYSRLKMLWQGDFAKWNDQNITALMNCKNLLTKENQMILERFIKMRKMGILQKLQEFYRLKIRRQTLLGNLGLLIAVLFNKI